MQSPRLLRICRLLALLLLLQSCRLIASGLSGQVPQRFGPTPAYGQNLLAATPDANATDPLIVAKAVELGNDPVRIFEYVRDEIGYESYEGSLRGARGTLWSKAGNALDQASLLIALLRASLIPARYVQGTLGDAEARELILSMFPRRLNIVGCPSDGSVRADPVSDPRLLAETSDHTWVEFDTGGGFTSADPTFPAAQIGEAFASPQGDFSEVPDNRRHKVTVRLRVEITGSIPTLPPDMKTPLDETFNTVGLAGKLLSVGHFVKTFSPPALIFGYVSHTYSPYIVIGQNDADVSDDPIIRGGDYQEFLTNFPLGSRFLTGVFLEIEVLSPNGQTKTFKRPFVDRIGFAARQNGGPANALALSGEEAALSELDLITINALPGLQSLDAIARQQERLAPLKTQLDTLQPLIDAIPQAGPQTGDQRAALNSAEDRMREVTIVGAETIAMTFTGASDRALRQLEQGYLTKAYYDSPRLVLVLTKKEEDALTVKLDIRKNDLRAVAAPGQVASIGPFFEMARGFMESALEAEVLETVTGLPGASAFGVFSNLPDGGAAELIHRDNLQRLETLSLSDEAKARISRAAAIGKMVVAPDRPVLLNGRSVIGWLEIDQKTGHTIAVMEDGGHQILVDYVSLTTTQQVLFGFVGTFIGFFQGYASGILTFMATFIEGLTDIVPDPFEEVVRAAKQRVELEISVTAVKLGIGIVSEPLATSIQLADCIFNTNLDTGQIEFNPTLILKCLGDSFLGSLTLTTVDIGLKAGSLGGMLVALGWIYRNFPSDPPVFPFLSSDLAPGPDPIAPGPQPGVNIAIVPDDFFTVLLDGAELPSVFKAQIQNTGPAEDTFEITFPGVPAGFAARSSVPVVMIPPGRTAEVGICLEPIDGLDPAGSAAPFTVEVASANDPAVTASGDEPFVMPEVPAVTVTANPVTVNISPGGSAPATFALTAVGNVSVDNISLDVDASPGLTVSGLASPVSLDAGESVSRGFTLTVDPGASLNETLSATISAAFDSSSKSATLLVQVVATAAQSAGEAALAASGAGRPELAGTLSELSRAVTGLSAGPEDPALRSRVIALLNSIIEQFNAPAFAPFVVELTGLKAALAAAAGSAVQTVLDDISGALASLAGLLRSQDAFPFEVSLQPNTALALPNTPATFGLSLKNTGSRTTTYNIGLGSLPPGITGGLSDTSVTLGPGEFIPSLQTGSVDLTITQPEQEITAFEFAVTVSVAGAPNLSRTAYGAFTARTELIEVTDVDAAPSFGDPGDPVSISARLFNAVNRTREFRVFYEVLDPLDATVFTSPSQDVELTVVSSVDTVDLGALDTSGFGLGTHRVKVTVTDLNNEPVPGATGQGTLLMGSPLTADLSVGQDVVPSCDANFTTTLQIASLIDLPPADIDILDVIDTGTATSVVFKKDQNIAYVCGTENIAIVDISDTSDLQIVGTFAEGISSYWSTCAIRTAPAR